MTETSHFTPDDALGLITACDTGERFVPNLTNFHDSAWLWDGAFIAAGLAAADPQRAARELTAVMGSRRADGMVPHVAMRRDLPLSGLKHAIAWGGDHEQRHKRTSGITQPPLLATAARIVSDSLPPTEAASFTADIFPKLVDYHEWFLDDRDTFDSGVVTTIHPWESGMDNSPSLVAGVHPGRFEKLAGRLIDPLRSDVRQGLDSAKRMTAANGIALALQAYKLRRRGYDGSDYLFDDPAYAVNSVLVNSVLISANKDLEQLGNSIGQRLPTRLQAYNDTAEAVIDHFWDERDGRFYNVDAVTGQPIRRPTIASVLPVMNPELLTADQSSAVLAQLDDETGFAAPYGAATVPRQSADFNPNGYWSGPMWPWINRFLYHGLRDMNEDAPANRLRAAVLDTVSSHGAYEHYNPLDGQPGGAAGFAPSAATFLELEATL